MPVVPAKYGTGRYGQSKYGVLASIILSGTSSLSFMVTSNNKIKLLAKATTRFVSSVFGRINNFPYRRT